MFRNRKINGSSSEASPRISQWRSFPVPCRYRDSEMMELKNCLPWTSSALPIKSHLIKVFTVLILVWVASSFSYYFRFLSFMYWSPWSRTQTQKSVADEIWNPRACEGDNKTLFLIRQLSKVHPPVVWLQIIALLLVTLSGCKETNFWCYALGLLECTSPESHYHCPPYEKKFLPAWVINVPLIKQ